MDNQPNRAAEFAAELRKSVAVYGSRCGRLIAFSELVGDRQDCLE